MATPIRIDFVSDVSCPWCAIGLASLRQAIGRLGDQVEVELHFQPFELNPRMPAGGQDTTEHLVEKYGGTPEQFDRNREAIRERGAALGVEFRMDRRGRIYNTFDAHRLLDWAGGQGEGRQLALKQALLAAYFTHGENPSDHETLVRIAGEVGLDAERARNILASDEFADAVRAQEQHYTSRGIQAVPSVIINDQHLLQGGQPPEVFERALRQIAGV
jgi:predicted DsbA family dithiol-disulfide isomerase